MCEITDREVYNILGKYRVYNMYPLKDLKKYAK